MVTRAIHFEPASFSKWTYWLQIAIVFFAIEGALWTAGRTQKVFYIAGAAAIILFTLTNRPRPRELGIGLRGVTGALWAIPIAIAGAACIVAIGWYLGTLRGLYGNNPVPWHASFYLLWALEQEFILNSFFYGHFEKLLGDSLGTAVLAAGLFSFCHIPNPVLVPATFLGGLFFVEVFRRFRNIYPLGIAHGILGLSLAISMPDNILRHMRVGLSFLRFHVHG